VIEVTKAFNDKLQSRLIMPQRNSDNSVIALTLTGDSFDSNNMTSCNAGYSLRVGEAVHGQDVPSNNQLCNVNEAFEMVTQRIVDMNLADVIIVVDGSGRTLSQILNGTEEYVIIRPFRIISAPEVSLDIIQLNLTSTSSSVPGIWGFGNVSAQARMVPTYTDFTSFVGAVCDALDIDKSTFAVSYNRDIGELSFHLQLSWSPVVASKNLSISAGLEPLASISADGSVSLTASVSANVNVIFNLRSAIPSLTAYCRFIDKAEKDWPAINFTVVVVDNSPNPVVTQKVIQLVNPIPQGGPFDNLGQRALGLQNAIRQVLVGSPLANMITVTGTTSSTGYLIHGMSTITFATNAGYNIRQISVTSSVTDFNCVFPVPAPSYELSIGDASIQGTLFFASSVGILTYLC
jgi:hypothetical protein